MRELEWSALFVNSMYISCVLGENVREMAKNEKFIKQSIYHLARHKILNNTVYFVNPRGTRMTCFVVIILPMRAK